MRKRIGFESAAVVASRRMFLSRATVGLVGYLGSPMLQAAAPESTGTQVIPDYAAFCGITGQRVQLLLPDWNGEVAATLVETGPLEKCGAGDQQFETWSLLFRIGGDSVIPDGIASFRHRKLGNWSFYVSAVGRAQSDAVWLEAVCSVRTGRQSGFAT